jgi:hypothetical protein
MLPKCEFKMQRISFVGFIVMLEGIEMKRDRVRIIAEWPKPASHPGIQRFLSFANFYRRIISSCSCFAKPMTGMLKGEENGRFLGPLVLTLVMWQSFAQLKEAFTRTPVLAHFNPARPIHLETDALGFARAGISSQ